MNRRKLERVVVMLLSIAMLLSSTGILSSLAANAGESSYAPSSIVSETSSSTEVSQDKTEVSTDVTEEGGSLVVSENGEGTETNPYRISSAEDFLKMQEKINLTTSSNKNFVLTSDIDLSGVTEETFKKNGGTLVTVNKALAKQSSNVFFKLDGNGHTIKGLNVTIKSLDTVAIFGYINAKSVISNIKVEKPVIKSKSDSMQIAAVLVTNNQGTVKNVEVSYPVLTASKGMYTGIVAAVNEGTISNVNVKSNQTNESAATADLHTISAVGTVGAVVAVNKGTISNVSAINIGMFVPENNTINTVYGGIAGRSEGKISNSVSTGNVCGGKTGDIAGGVVGKASAAELKLANDYTLVSIANTVSGCAVIGAAGTAEMLSDCYWSSKVSGRYVPATDVADSGNDIFADTYKVVNVGKSVKINASDVKSAIWGKAVFALNGSFASKSTNAVANSDATEMTIKGTKADEICTVHYTAAVALPASVGSGTVTLKQNMSISVLTVSDSSKGNGTKANPLVITNSEELLFINYAPSIYCKLDKDVSLNRAVPYFSGEIDGNGHTITANSQVFSNVSGTVKNTNVIIAKDTSFAAFGNVIEAEMTNVAVSQKAGTKLVANSGNNGIFAGRLIGKSSLDNCRVKGDIYLPDDLCINIGGFAGNVAGKDTVITNSGAVVNLSQKDGKKLASTANFIGTVSADNVQLENCYVGGKNTAGRYLFIGSIGAKKISVKNVLVDYSADKNAAAKPLSFGDYGSLVSESQFKEWTFTDGQYGFFTGNSGKFEIELPAIKAIQNSSSSDFTTVIDSSKAVANVTVDSGKAVLNVARVGGVVTVKTLPVTIVNNKTGLTATIYVSNGLEKDANGNWLVSSAFDLAYIGENISDMKNASFLVTKDLDMSEIKNYVAIGSAGSEFSGTFDGANHTISNLTINGTANTALFGTISGATVKNIKLSDASIKSNGGYAAVLAGHVKGKTVISNITVANSNVTVNENYSAILVASVNYAENIKISDITVTDSTIKSSASYVGAVAGRTANDVDISNVVIDNVKVSGSNNVSGVVGVSAAEKSVTLNNVKVNNSKINGVSYVSGIVSGEGKGTTVKNSGVYNSEIITEGTASSFVAGGIAASFDSTIENVTVESTLVRAGIAGGIVGRTADTGALVIKNAQVKKSTVSAEDANTVAAGILAIHKSTASVNITDSFVSEDTVIKGAAVTSAVVGDFAGRDGTLKINGVKTLADVQGCETANAVSAAGILGRTGSVGINNISISNVKVGGKLSGSGVLGGAVGFIKEGGKYNGESSFISDSVVYNQINAFDEKTQTGMIVGGTGSKKIFAADDMNKAFSNIVTSTYFASVPVYSAGSGLEGGKIIDMDKPNGNAISSSLPMLSTTDETSVEITNLPKISGYSFDEKTGWVSESDERVKVVSGTEKTAVLKAEHMADISIVAYYVLESDTQVRIPVHFRIVADIRIPLKGSGTKENPYQVSGAYDLETVTRYSKENAYFVLTNDIVFTPEDFEFGGAFYNVGNGVITIGDAENGFRGSFSGLYNGKVHSITGLAVAGNAFGGLFGATDGAAISDMVINNADISGLNYAAVIAGSAKNTTIKNITINASDVKAVEFGSYAGSVVGYAENTVIENVRINNTSVKSTLDATEATVEIAGGVAGVFDGTIKTVSLNNVTVESGTFAGGFAGVVRDNSVKILDSEVNAVIRSEVAGGAVGKIDNPQKFSISGCIIGGKVNGTKTAAGVIGEVTSENASDRVIRINSPMISDTIITALISDAQTKAVAIGKASSNVFTDADNSKTNVFDKVYYSSYQNDMGVFGNEEINTYQTSEYTAIDLSELKYVSDGVEKDYISLGNDYFALSTDSIKMNSVDGTYKAFDVGNDKFVLESVKSDVDGAITYDASSSAIKFADSEIESAKVVFAYNNGLELAIDAVRADVLSGKGTESEPYEVYNVDDFEIMLQNAASNVYYALKADIKLTGINSVDLFAGVLDGQGHVLYDFSGSNLFGRLTGRILNTGFVGFKVSDNSSASVGAVAAVIDGGKIADSYVVADVSASGSRQDVGILAGRMQNNAVVTNVMTTGKAVGRNALAVGGVIGSMTDSKLSNVTSTAYVKGDKAVGGIVGEANNTELNKVIFAGMVENSGACGNIVGVNNDSKVSNAYYDSQTSRVSVAYGSGSKEISATPLSTGKLSQLSLEGFVHGSGYPVPESLSTISNSKFATGADFAAMKVNYLAGLTAGTVYNYTSIYADSEVNGNEVKMDTSSGMTLTLVPSADFADAENAITRYSNPVSTSAVNVSYNVIDATNGKLGSKLIGLLFKNKIDDKSCSFDLFTKADAQSKQIGSVVVSDGGFYVDAELPQGVNFSVSAVDENGKALNIQDSKNEGKFVSTGSAKSVVVTITAKNETKDIWGLRSIWGVIGK